MTARKKVSDEKVAQIFQLVELGVLPTRAATALGLSDNFLSMRKKRDPQFALDLAAAEARAENRLFDKMNDLAMGGDRKAIEFLLERRWPERWARPEVRETREDQDGVEPDTRYL